MPKRIFSILPGVGIDVQFPLNKQTGVRGCEITFRSYTELILQSTHLEDPVRPAPEVIRFTVAPLNPFIHPGIEIQMC